MTDIHHNEEVLEADESYDIDSTYEGSVGDASYTSSITSSVLNYKYENGRRYHAFHDGEYFLPNDEQEQDRLDLSHHVYRLILDGIWAIEVADEFPDAEVIGNDLSPIQPPWTPPNCRFEIDDFEQTWQYSRPFDFIHGRELEGSVRDYGKLFKQAFDNLVPGGYFEIASIEANVFSEDGTHEKAKNLVHLEDSIHSCFKKFGKELRTAKTFRDEMVKAGFENVEEHIFKLPLSPWPKDSRLREIGRYYQVNLLEALGPYTYALLTRFGGWSKEEIEVLNALTRNEIKDLSNHIRTDLYMVYGRKPN